MEGREGGMEGGREGGREGVREGGREGGMGGRGGREGGEGGEGGMTVIHILICMFNSNPLHTFIHYKPRGFYGTTCKTSIKVPVTGNASVKIATPLWRATLHDLTPLLQVVAVIRLRSR